MWRTIIISILVIYLVNKLGGMLMRFMGHSGQVPPTFRRPGDNSINMDTPPKKPNRKSGLKGGEYVDYEEVK
jgi:hypothetical protein